MSTEYNYKTPHIISDILGRPTHLGLMLPPAQQLPIVAPIETTPNIQEGASSMPMITRRWVLDSLSPNSRSM